METRLFLVFPLKGRVAIWIVWCYTTYTMKKYIIYKSYIILVDSSYDEVQVYESDNPVSIFSVFGNTEAGVRACKEWIDTTVSA